MKIKKLFFNLISFLLIPFFSIYSIQVINPSQNLSSSISSQSKEITFDNCVDEFLDSIEKFEDEKYCEKFLSHNEGKLHELIDTITTLAQIGTYQTTTNDEDELNRDIASLYDCSFKNTGSGHLAVCCKKSMYKKTTKSFKKACKKVSKFFKKNKKAILIGTSVVVAIVGIAIIGSAILAPAATAAAGAVANSSSSDSEKPKHIKKDTTKDISEILATNVEKINKTINNQVSMDSDTFAQNMEESSFREQFKDVSKELCLQSAHEIVEYIGSFEDAGKAISDFSRSILPDSTVKKNDQVGDKLFKDFGYGEKKEPFSISKDIHNKIDQFFCIDSENNYVLKNELENEIQEAFKHLIDNPAIGELPIFGGMFKNAKNAKKVLDTLRNVKKVGNQYINLKKFADAGKVIDRKGLTKAGRALAKHGGRKGSVFPKPKGNPAKINKQGQQILEEILNNPNKKIIPDKKGYEIYLPNGRGAYFNKEGKLRGFVEWKKR